MSLPKAVLITGSASGLGLTIAKSLLAHNFLVTISDINPSRLAAAKADLSTTYPSLENNLLALEANVADEASVKALIDQSVAHFGHLDIVINNAGIMDKFDPAADCDTKLWDAILAVNLTGAFLVTKHALPHLLLQQHSSGSLIVNIGSTASFSGLTAGVAYTASKHGLVALTKHTAGFYGPRGVYSVALMPGGMNETNISDAFAAGMNVEGFKAVKEAHPKMNNVPVDHVARYVAFLCEDGIGQSANGSCIALTGNWPEA
ncbi:hypothetical protein HDV57DRAFT_505405 [Trichoderma longibrachiatum]|uniref:NAD(P)-binding protein n=1 Tax=Trichoderma longibrachiatum ATCC 18648 TaxID=983965 RepID=A0A2T4BTN4_TRILO|nr:NAD(P)-binding protein [Trichoderma longibrachiatum ATCC 18648]